MDKPMTFNKWMGKQGNLALVHANCCRIAYEAGQQSQQAKVEELQKRVDQQGLIIAKAMSIASDLQKSWSMFEIGKKLEQALKGEG
ncbi:MULTISPECIES: hypothetical protein [Acinetobacter]|uniref:hypothetical protein n=1 Tax=Acinetobacter TaxID=469 RepID=UPI001EEC3BEB|nr:MULTISPECIES: hypothetical protein [Acinetobacter]MCO9048494.1 hypothetical protein [Acinetobacter sp. UC24323]